jgi:hypothetical protein
MLQIYCLSWRSPLCKGSLVNSFDQIYMAIVVSKRAPFNQHVSNTTHLLATNVPAVVWFNMGLSMTSMVAPVRTLISWMALEDATASNSSSQCVWTSTSRIWPTVSGGNKPVIDGYRRTASFPSLNPAIRYFPEALNLVIIYGPPDMN